MTNKDGGQAFPTGDSTHGGNEGMTLRDYFAAKAMEGLTSIEWGYQNIQYDELAEMAYRQADAMLAERERTMSKVEKIACSLVDGIYRYKGFYFEVHEYLGPIPLRADGEVSQRTPAKFWDMWQEFNALSPDERRRFESVR